MVHMTPVSPSRRCTARVPQEIVRKLVTRADVLRAVAAVNANKVVLAVGHERRFEPPILDLMRTVKSGELGTPLQIGPRQGGI